LPDAAWQPTDDALNGLERTRQWINYQARTSGLSSFGQWLADAGASFVAINDYPLYAERRLTGLREFDIVCSAILPAEQNLVPTGRVKFFNPDRGYGFIAPDGGESDVFVHISAVEAAGMDTLVAGQLLAYDVGIARDGRSKAINLRLLNPER
jgi:cold shock protein